MENNNVNNATIFDQASKVFLDLGTTDTQITKFLKNFYAGDQMSEGNLQMISYLMNMRSQRSSLLSNLEDKRHNGAMTIISNMK